MTAVTYSNDNVVASRDILAFYVEYSEFNDFPADTLAWGQEWGTVGSMPNPWLFAGLTQGGLNFSAEVTRGDIRMDQAIDPVLRPATGRNITMSTNLGEFDLSAIKTAVGQGVVTTKNPTTAVPGYDQWTLDASISNTFFSIAYDIQPPQQTVPLRLLGLYGQPTGAENWNFSPEAAAVTPFNISLFPRPSDNLVAIIRDLIPHT